MKMFSKVTSVIAILAITALCFALPDLEPDERSYTDVNTNNQVKFSINTDFWASGLSSTEIEGTGLDIFCFPWIVDEDAQPHIYTITLTEPYHIDVAQGIDIENESVVPNPDGYGYLAKGVKEVTFRFPPHGDPDKGDIYVIVYSEVGVIYGISGIIDNTAYNKNYLLITDANNYMGDNVSSEVPSSSVATDFVSYYKDRDMLHYGAVSPYETTTFPYELCSMLQIFRYRRFEYGVTFSSDIRKEDYISYLKELVSALRDDNNCSGVIFYCNDKSFYHFANDACWEIRGAIGDPVDFYTCIIQREETYHDVPNSRDAYISSDAYEKGYAIGYEFVRNGVQKNQFIYGENRGVFFIPTQSIVNSNNQTVLEPKPLLEYGIYEGISRAQVDLDITSMNISHQILYCENTQEQLEFYLHQLFSQTAENLFGENRYNIIGLKVFYNFVGNFDLGIINELSKDETLNGLPTVSNIFVEDATLYCRANENVINGNEVCRESRYFDADFTSVIGLSKTNSIVSIFAKYLLGKTGHNQYYLFVDSQQPRGYTVGTTNYLLRGYYINYVTRVINLAY